MKSILTRPERPADNLAIEALHHAAFGPGAYTRAAFRVREQAPHDPALSFVTEEDGTPIASVRLTPIDVGGRGGLLLGPLVVDPAHKNMGYGKALMRLSMEEARKAGCPSSSWSATSPITGHSDSGRRRRGASSCPGRSTLRGCSSPSSSRTGRRGSKAWSAA